MMSIPVVKRLISIIAHESGQLETVLETDQGIVSLTMTRAEAEEFLGRMDEFLQDPDAGFQAPIPITSAIIGRKQ